MKQWKACLCMAAALLFMALVFRPGYRILINGMPLKDIYDHDTALRCAAAVTQAAEEITRKSEAPPFTLVPVLCLGNTESEDNALYHTLLSSYEGIQQMYALYLNDRRVGTTASPDLAQHLQREFFPTASIHETLVIAKPVYSYTGAENSLPELRQAMAFALAETNRERF